jgi:hypothetical protein
MNKCISFQVSAISIESSIDLTLFICVHIMDCDRLLFYDKNISNGIGTLDLTKKMQSSRYSFIPVVNQ